MQKRSAGLLVYRFHKNTLEVLLIHPGGPFWQNKDAASWSIPKGLYETGEHPLDAAKREFMEETGFNPPKGDFVELTPQKQPSGKIVSAWAIQGDYDTSKMVSNMFEMEWPPKSGKMAEFPEADRAEWFNMKDAKKKILKGQLPFLDELNNLLKV
ncbi:MAG: NUDIX domain-containing protein [Phycisphaerales bacterium]